MTDASSGRDRKAGRDPEEIMVLVFEHASVVERQR